MYLKREYENKGCIDPDESKCSPDSSIERGEKSEQQRSFPYTQIEKTSTTTSSIYVSHHAHHVSTNSTRNNRRRVFRNCISSNNSKSSLHVASIHSAHKGSGSLGSDGENKLGSGFGFEKEEYDDEAKKAAAVEALRKGVARLLEDENDKTYAVCDL